VEWEMFCKSVPKGCVLKIRLFVVYLSGIEKVGHHKQLEGEQEEA
jgi:hypothetical protein